MAKKDIKALLPSLKERKRYLVFEIISKNEISDFMAVKDEITASMASLIGDLGMAKANVRFIDEKTKANKGLIMLNHDFVGQLRASLALIRTIKGIPAIARSIGVSGMIDKAEAYL
jgi:RNase P/RNase MRP subunit POP5